MDSRMLWRQGRELQAAGRLLDAIDAYRASLASDDSQADKWNDLGNALANAAMLPEAHDAYREALKRNPAYHQVESNLLINLHYDPSIIPEEMFAAHRAWAARHASGIVANPPARRTLGPSDRIRVGFMSPALRSGPTGAYLAPLLEHLDPARFVTFCYRTAGSEDETTARLKRAAYAWRDCIADDDAALDARIRGDRLDILVDLAGHTPGGRLLVLARKPAPVIATWLDYFDTTGLDAVDYLVGDPVSTPAGGRQKFSEKVVLLDPCRFCYAPPPYAPEVAPAPLLRNGYVTFGSFNRLSKLAPPVIALWAKVLAAVPGSRLILKNGALADERMRERVAALFASEGIGEERLTMRSHSPHAQMLAEYGDIDIALDPFPFNGGLTTCEALWMGVPVLCVTGTSMIARQGDSLLGAASMGQWAAGNPVAAVEKARQMAGAKERLVEARGQQRQALARSALVDGRRFAHAFGRILEGMA
jgi:protein O-GlcNAc transferase